MTELPPYDALVQALQLGFPDISVTADDVIWELITTGKDSLANSENPIWKCAFTQSLNLPEMALKIGTGPMPEILEMEIQIYQSVFPNGHEFLPKFFAMTLDPTPLLLMENLCDIGLGYPLEPEKLPSSDLVILARNLGQMVRDTGDEESLIKAKLERPKRAVGDTPLGLSCGGLTLRNVGRRKDGTIIIFDWDGACIAPLGWDLRFFAEHKDYEKALSEYFDTVND